MRRLLFKSAAGSVTEPDMYCLPALCTVRGDSAEYLQAI